MIGINATVVKIVTLWMENLLAMYGILGCDIKTRPPLHGKYRDDRILLSVMLPANTALTPEVLLKSVKCKCKESIHRCSYDSSGIACGSVFKSW